MRTIVDNIERNVIYRKKARMINRLIMTTALGEENLKFIAEAVKEVEWESIRKEPEDDFVCDILGDCGELEYRYKLNLQTMDLARIIPESGTLFEYIDFDEDPEEIKGALLAIEIMLEYFEEE